MYPKLHISMQISSSIIGSEVMILRNIRNFPKNFGFLNKYDHL